MSAVVLDGSRSTRVIGGRTLAQIEADFRKPGRTFFGDIFGFDPFDFWVGPFFVGLWGVTAILGIIIGVYFYADAVIFHGPYSYAQNFIAGKLAPPPAAVGLGLAAPGTEGFKWQMTILFASLTFFSWMMRQADICRKLELGYHVPLSYSVVFSAWLTLQVVRPLAMGRWSEGFVLGVLPHLDWIIQFGYRYNNFFYNPFHALGITGLFTSTLLLGMHGSAILSATQCRSADPEASLHNFWRDIVGYSIGEDGIHRLATLVAAGAVLVSNLCILSSGWLVKDWVGFWLFWNNLPWWRGV